jgi:hypothetical protein
VQATRRAVWFAVPFVRGRAAVLEEVAVKCSTEWHAMILRSAISCLVSIASNSAMSAIAVSCLSETLIASSRRTMVRPMNRSWHHLIRFKVLFADNSLLQGSATMICSLLSKYLNAPRAPPPQST